MTSNNKSYFDKIAEYGQLVIISGPNGVGKSTVIREYIAQHPEKAAFCLDFKGVFLRLERAGDHITNLAEEIVFYIDAVVLKHSAKKGGTEQALLKRMQEGQE